MDTINKTAEFSQNEWFRFFNDTDEVELICHIHNTQGNIWLVKEVFTWHFWKWSIIQVASWLAFPVTTYVRVLEAPDTLILMLKKYPPKKNMVLIE